MALKAKGYASNIGHIDFVNNMPKSDDPNTGFYLDIYSSEPRTEAHWIAPAPLASYGASQSGANVVNITGTSLDGLDAEVVNGNSVVLAGYNSVTGEQVIVDTWSNGGVTKYNVSKNVVESTYRASGTRAVVVR